MAIIPKDAVDAEDTGYYYVTQDDIIEYSGVLDMDQELLELMREHPEKAFGALYEPAEQRYKFYWFKE